MHIIDVHNMKWRLKFNSHPNTPHKLKSLSKLTKRLQFPLRKGLCKHIFSILLWGDIHKIYNSFLYFRTHKVASSDLEGGNQYFGCPPPKKKWRLWSSISTLYHLLHLLPPLLWRIHLHQAQALIWSLLLLPWAFIFPCLSRRISHIFSSLSLLFQVHTLGKQGSLHHNPETLLFFLLASNSSLCRRHA